MLSIVIHSWDRQLVPWLEWEGNPNPIPGGATRWTSDKMATGASSGIPRAAWGLLRGKGFFIPFLRVKSQASQLGFSSLHCKLDMSGFQNKILQSMSLPVPSLPVSVPHPTTEYLTTTQSSSCGQGSICLVLSWALRLLKLLLPLMCLTAHYDCAIIP